MAGWSVEGRGAEVTVTSADGDVYPFLIASAADLHLELREAPRWRGGRPPADAQGRIGEAFDEAARWTEATFGEPAP